MEKISARAVLPEQQEKSQLPPIERMARLYSMLSDGIGWFCANCGARLEPVFNPKEECGSGVIIHSGFSALCEKCGIEPERINIVSREGFERYEFEVGGVKFFTYEEELEK